jgi:cytochrome c553
VTLGTDGRGGPTKTVACMTCHGLDLMGLGEFPGIAGRSPSYMARQLWDMKKGTRNGTYAEIMKPVVANLSADDVTAIVAFLASIKPPAPTTTTAAR